ncbi:MAG TPA: Stk1 family PASTA domain-containing Ser/Thr kinase [Clostridia bacterium]|nr:Stk1 family PASTA domain-containing Ser/Thr kinase [Clostridia bacterium]
MNTLIGQIVGNRYEIEERLGGGGMAVVYKAKDRLLSRAVTVKILRDQFANDREVVRRFLKEAQSVAKLSHPNIVSIYDVGQDQGLYYLVMEYVEGCTLKDVIQTKGRLDPLEAIEYALQICDALQHAHDSNIIHRDIKPQNILITKKGQAKVTDFGIAKAATNATMTYSGSSILGTVQYISPEQARGDLVTVHTDIYSAGIVLYEMLTGRLPFEGDTAISIAIKHIQMEYPAASQIVPDLPGELEAVLAKALAKKPEERFASALDMKRALEEVRDKLGQGLSQTVVLPRVTRKTGDEGARERPKSRRPRLVSWVLFLLALTLLAAGSVYFGINRYLAVSEVEVPDVTNIPLREAERILFEHGLNWEIGMSRHDDQVPPDYVLAQRPAAGEKIKKTRAVVLDVSLGPNMGRIPDVIGLSQREARVEIANAGFKVAQDVGESYSDVVPEGHVLDQEPGPNAEVPLGTEVILTISLGPQPRYITMPDLVGKTLAEATEILEQNYLEFEVHQETSHEYFSGYVTGQDIPPGEQVLQRTTVNLTVSLGPGPAAKTATIQVWVQDDGEQHRIKVVIEDQTGLREAYNAVHDPNDFISIEVPYYGQGKAQVYEDDVLIQETALQ